MSLINVAILGVFLEPVYHRMQNSTDNAIQNHVYWQGGIFTSGALESLSSLTGQQMEKRVQAALAPQGCQICFFDTRFHKFGIFRDSWRQKIVRFFLLFDFFGGSWHMLSDWYLRLSKTWFDFFLKRCLATLLLPTFFPPKAKIALQMTSASNYNRFIDLTPLT